MVLIQQIKGENSRNEVALGIRALLIGRFMYLNQYRCIQTSAGLQPYASVPVCVVLEPVLWASSQAMMYFTIPQLCRYTQELTHHSVQQDAVPPVRCWYDIYMNSDVLPGLVWKRRILLPPVLWSEAQNLIGQFNGKGNGLNEALICLVDQQKTPRQSPLRKGQIQKTVKNSKVESGTQYGVCRRE